MIRSFRLTFSSHILISSISFLSSLFFIFLEKVLQLILVLYFPLVLKLSKFRLVLILDLQLIFFFLFFFFFECFTEYRICKLSLLYYSAVRNSGLSILLANEVDIFAASLLILCCSFSSLTLSSIINIILSNIFFLKRDKLSDARIVSKTKQE